MYHNRSSINVNNSNESNNITNSHSYGNNTNLISTSLNSNSNPNNTPNSSGDRGMLYINSNITPGLQNNAIPLIRNNYNNNNNYKNNYTHERISSNNLNATTTRVSVSPQPQRRITPSFNNVTSPTNIIIRSPSINNIKTNTNTKTILHHN